MNMIRNLNDNTRTVVYAAINFVLIVCGITAFIVLMEVLSYYFGDDAVFAITILGFGIGIVGMMSWMAASSKVSEENHYEREIQRRLEESLSD